ncbi:unnamed protein product [Sphenostylis stenocarpa]|uniref:UDP-N-acetylglucosamine transferase subunit ALG14 n=1 Tax=Sphenostylis stenocarpa TaxID=92480 RepID=A0AA86V936_9FABA|nr:unnamed protein product [Sphenostylis stenocarpa]
MVLLGKRMFDTDFETSSEPKSSCDDVCLALTEILKLPLMDKCNGCSFSNVSSIAVFSSAVFVVSLILVRLLYVIYHSRSALRKRASKPVSTLIILGSGGHTAEMLNLLAVLQKDRFNPRFYIAAATDNMSLQKAQLLEDSLAAQNETRVTDTAQFMKIYRSREVGQSYITSIWTTLIAMVHALWLMIKIRPEVVLGIRWSSIFYVESIARVRRLSLSGLLLYKLRMADQLFVQWPQLQRQYPRATYVGRLIEASDLVIKKKNKRCEFPGIYAYMVLQEDPHRKYHSYTELN